jgi:protein-S-isoprenylcysteine O-methyltransferase Ste14
MTSQILLGVLYFVEIVFTYIGSNEGAADSTIFRTLCGDLTASAKPFLSSTFLVSVACIVFGSGLRVVCYRSLGTHFTYNLSIRDNHKLITTGPYHVVRHPSYTGSIIIAIGVTLAELAPGSWWTEARVMQTTLGKLVTMFWVCVLVLKVLLLARAPKEDEILRERFGKEWETYAKSVRYWFVPYVV